MNGNGVGWKNCKTCENIVKSLKSMHSFTLSQAVQWAEFHSSLGLVWSPGLLFKTPDIENSKCVTVFTAVRCNPQTSHHGEKCSNPDVHEGGGNGSLSTVFCFCFTFFCHFSVSVIWVYEWYLILTVFHTRGVSGFVKLRVECWYKSRPFALCCRSGQQQVAFAVWKPVFTRRMLSFSLKAWKQ